LLIGLNQQSAVANQKFKDAEMRDIIALACTECKRRNYSTTKNKKKTSERLELSKYCRFCRKHTGHRETK
jgi:large subunit ribosomal protein L33